MIHFELLRDRSILIVTPQGSLEKADFERVGREIDPFIPAKGKLTGVMICAKSFPRWKSFEALLSHFKFVGEHHRQVERVATVRATIRSLLAACAIAMAIGAPAAAGPLEDGNVAYHMKEYAKAAELWQPLAQKGNAIAQYSLGTLYAEGNGVTQNDATAFMWFQRAANQGNAAAQYNVGASYAAGTGVEKSDADAIRWFRRAADQGMAFAQLNLGLLYAAGNGVAQDNVEALKWLEIAFRGLPAGGARMDVAHAMQDVGAKMTSDQIDEAKQRAREWKAKPDAQ